MEQSLRQSLESIAIKSKNANRQLSKLSSKEKNSILSNIKKNIILKADEIIKANLIDMDNAKKIGLKEGVLDRLLLTENRVRAMAESVETLIDLKDPVGNIYDMRTLENGLIVGKKTVPIGVLAIIYEARPNVTLDASILAIKSSNSLILRGGKEAINSNISIVKIIRESISELGYDENMICLIEDTTRESSVELMKLKGYIDLLIPRGSASLINSVIENSKVPVLETGVGNCHVYVDSSAKIEMALNIIENAKTSRIGVCNAMESLLVSEDISDNFYEGLQKIINQYNIIIHGCEKTMDKINNVIYATDEDYGKEYLDYEMSMKVVSGIDEAIDHIYRYSTNHSEVIITENYENAMKFLNEVDSACVYVNASSRFTDGGIFGFGAEIGISTQKLHARGPVGLNELTSSKYVILGSGQVRE
ncbi:glutamate-5-semialdehyde dehydrogenase [Peptoniphilus sp. oral taxon 386]|uniref:glutamate-5-semialdehyde dehydrogenase n=1 Tax=Peptoniphilus sp. oral taxon 386 TaxID=652713 RepID=UPI0001DA9C25|nr:glutamate-5-semialdehyde dehydrogenase [Peptoniphilus sp. oral taxon 386]EFI42405.1 glutamate-5-semialdehyde dehydrogenase [Peptoniphilus sp. oral taxon 386 str. F0131]